MPQTSSHHRRVFALRAGLCAVLSVVICSIVSAQDRRPNAGRSLDDVEVIRDVTFGTTGDRSLRLHVLRSTEPTEGPSPAVVWIHGGAWLGGDRDAGIGRLAPLVRQGYVGVSIEYRLSPEATFPAQIEDCKAAIRFLRAEADQFGIDPDRIGVWGSSAGGHLVALLGTSGDVEDLEGEGGNPGVSSRVQAVCDFFGPTDFLRMNDTPGQMDHEAPNSPESLLIGGPIREHPDRVAQANPITYVSADDPPFLIVHGDRDPLVPLNQSELLRDSLRSSGVPVTLHVVEGGGHGQGFPSEVDRMVVDFFDRILKPAEDSISKDSDRR